MIIKTFGPPGTGKTERLIKRVKMEQDSGVSLPRMGYLSFSKAAREVIKARMKTNDKELRWFRTIHGAAAVYIGMQNAVIMPRDYQAFSDATGMRISPEDSLDYTWDQDRSPDYNITLRALNLATTACRPIEEVLRQFPVHRNLVLERVLRFSQAWTDYKRQMGRFDFMDMLSKFDAEGGPLDIDVGSLRIALRAN